VPRPPRRPRPLRDGLAALAVLFALHAAARDPLDAARLETLRWFAGPPAVVRRALEPERPRTVPGRGASEARRAARRAAFEARGAAAVPVVDLRPREGVLILGAGRDAGVRLGAAASSNEGLLGHVDRLEARLARVRLTASKGARLAVALDGKRSGLPGGIERLSAVLEGDGRDAALVEGSLLQEFKPGDRLVAFGPSRAPTGVVVGGGARPRVKLFARPDSSGAVSVEGVGARAAVAELFVDEPLRVELEPALEGRGALLSGPAAERLSVGAALHADGVYLGRVELRTSSTAYAGRLFDPGHEVGVRWTHGGIEGGMTLRGDGGGRFRAVEGDLPPDGAEFPAFTAGGRGLAPPDLFVGTFAREGEGFRAVEGETRWPAEVSGATFLFEEERARLLGPGAR